MLVCWSSSKSVVFLEASVNFGIPYKRGLGFRGLGFWG